jgi:LCP family protein required for cell wall assembly
VNLILIGQASAMEDGHYGADAIRLVRVDFDQGSAAILALAQTVVDSFAFIPDHYITVRGEPFVQMVDTLGGITVTIPGDILDVPSGWSVFYSGTQKLDGKQTLDYVRLLLPAESGYASLWERFDRQNQVLQALLESCLQIENWGALPELIKVSRRILVTDLSTNQADDLACMVQEVGEGPS